MPGQVQCHPELTLAGPSEWKDPIPSPPANHLLVLCQPPTSQTHDFLGSPSSVSYPHSSCCPLASPVPAPSVSPAPLGETRAARISVPTHLIIIILGLFLKSDLCHEYVLPAYTHMTHVRLVPVEARRRHPVPWSWVVLSCYVSFRN